MALENTKMFMPIYGQNWKMPDDNNNNNKRLI